MAKYDIKHSCGHVITHDICGKMDQRSGRADWLATEPCNDCRRASDLAVATAATSELPALVGSPKQIAWANKIRAAVYAEFGAALRPGVVLDGRAAAVAGWLWSRPASWWIDNRDTGGLRAWLALAQKEFFADDAGRRFA